MRLCMLNIIPSSDVKTIEELLKPISEESPCGPYLKRDPTINRLKELRVIVTDLSSGMWKPKAKQGDTVAESIKISEEFLTTTSKDLFAATYYTEALLKKYGFFGLEHGLSVIYGLCQLYWEKFNPDLTEDQAPMRMTAFKLLNTILNDRLSVTPIVITSDNKLLTSYDILKKEKGHEPTKVKNNIITELAKESQNTLSNFKEKIQNTLHVFDDLTNRTHDLDILLHTEEGPIFSKHNETLNLVLELINAALNPEALKNAQADAIIGASSDEVPVSASNVVTENNINITGLKAPSGNPLKTIQEAYDMIDKINEFLLKNDTHSPSPALIKRAIEWRKKDMYELYVDIFSGLSRPEELFTLLAIKPKPQPPVPIPQTPGQAGGVVPPPYSPPAAPGAGFGGGYPPGGDQFGGGGYPSPYGGAGTPNPYGSGDLGGGYPPSTPGGYPPSGGGGYNPYGGGGGF